jgi:hypothetical protein
MIARSTGSAAKTTLPDALSKLNAMIKKPFPKRRIA